MKNYQIYFEIFGKKLKTTILAKSEEHAKEIVKNKIIFHNVVLKPNDKFNDVADALDNVMDILKGKK